MKTLVKALQRVVLRCVMIVMILGSPVVLGLAIWWGSRAVWSLVIGQADLRAVAGIAALPWLRALCARRTERQRRLREAARWTCIMPLVGGTLPAAVVGLAIDADPEMMRRLLLTPTLSLLCILSLVALGAARTAPTPRPTAPARPILT